MPPEEMLPQNNQPEAIIEEQQDEEEVQLEDALTEQDQQDQQEASAPELSPEEQEKQERMLGAKILSAAGIQSRYASVESSFDRARARGEKLPGNNAERRAYSYLSRLEDIVQKQGSVVEQYIWQESARKVIINPDNITDAFWRLQERELRENGTIMTVNDAHREIATDSILRQQKSSIRSWTDYLGDEETPYPLWFKIYAFDGVAKMGLFDAKKGFYSKRDRTTVAPFPHLNHTALRRTYEAVRLVYCGDPETGEANADSQLAQLVRSNNFNRIYSHFRLQEAPILKTPERAEDVHGEWVEYAPGDEERIATAAENTPWCIADEEKASSYLEQGEDARFIFFHLTDPETGQLSSNACASIRLGGTGEVAEISGIAEGQDLEDSLVDIVETKAKGLPGGERYLEAFADKKHLTHLDEDMQKGKQFSGEDISFIFELERPIKLVNKHKTVDDRVPLLRQYILDNLGFLDGTDIDISTIVSKLTPMQQAENLGNLQEHGANIDTDSLIDQLIEYRETSDSVRRRGRRRGREGVYSPSLRILTQYLDSLIANGVNIDAVMARVQRLQNPSEDEQDTTTEGLSRRRGARFSPNDVKALIEHGADAEAILGLVDSVDSRQDLEFFTAHAVPTDLLLAKSNSVYSRENLEFFTTHAVPTDLLIAKSRADAIISNIDLFDQANMELDINKLISELPSDHWNRCLDDHLDRIIRHGVDMSLLLSKLRGDQILVNLDLLLEYGAEVDLEKLASYSKTSSYDLVIKHYDTFVNHNVQVDVESLYIAAMAYGEGRVLYYLDFFSQHGIDVGERINAADIEYSDIAPIFASKPESISKLVDFFEAQGYHLDVEYAICLTEGYREGVLEEKREEFIAAGVDPEFIDAIIRRDILPIKFEDNDDYYDGYYDEDDDEDYGE